MSGPDTPTASEDQPNQNSNTKVKSSCEITCGICNRIFHNRSNYNRHVKTKHKINSEGYFEDQSVSCLLCGKWFTQKSSLLRHMKTVHTSNHNDFFKCPQCNFQSKYKVNLQIHIAKHTRIQENVQDKKFVCSLCDKRYLSKRTLYSHERKIHRKPKPIKILRRCPICSFSSKELRKEDMYRHFEKTHCIKLQWEKHSFTSNQEFLKWKSEVEEQCDSSFVKRSGRIGNIEYFYCHRDGNYRNRGLNKRKRMRLYRINACCPANMKVTIEPNQQISVLFLSTHVGHTNKLRIVRLTEKKIRNVANKLALEKPLGKISNDLQDSNINNELQNVHLQNENNITNFYDSFIVREEIVNSQDCNLSELSCSYEDEEIVNSQDCNLSELNCSDEDEEIVNSQDCNLSKLSCSDEDEEIVNSQDCNLSKLSCSDEDDKQSFETSLNIFTSELVQMIKENVHTSEELQLLKNYFSGLLPSLKALKSQNTTHET